MFFTVIIIYNTYTHKKSLKSAKGTIRIRKSKKDSQHNDQKRTKELTAIYKTLHTKINIE